MKTSIRRRVGGDHGLWVRHAAGNVCWASVISPWVMETGRVDREYLDGTLRRLVTDAGFHPQGWTHAEVREYRRLADGARAAKVDTDLRTMRLLRIEPHADDPLKAQATLSSGRVIGLTFKSSNGPVVLELPALEMDTP